MKPTARTVWIILFVLYVVTVAWLCFGNFSTDSDIPREIWGLPIDKCVHFMMFLPFPILGTIAFQKTSWWRTLSWTTLIAMVIAFTFENLQSRINPLRCTDPADLNANILGITTGLLIMVLIGLSGKKK